MSTTHSDDKILIINKVKDYNPIWCHVCNNVLIGIEDIKSNKDNNCCNSCWLAFGQGRREEWKNGWRPDKETLKRYKTERSILNVSIEDIIGE